MCGICGYVGAHRPELLGSMATAMRHRGPDDAGAWHDGAQRVGLAHRRLSIIDLSPAGRQPMCNEDETVWISYNGEIYNFQAHREALLQRGHRFKSQSDTEVLVHLYEELGPDMLQQLNGMFALALWDARRQQLLLARDHAGIKPLYYWQNGDSLYFASEIKALLKIPEIPREMNRACLPAYFTFLWVPGDETMLRGIRKVEPGHYLLWKDGRTAARQWFHLAYESDNSVSTRDWIEQVHDVFLSTCRRQMVSDVPLGAFLSGGTDSSSIVACMRRSFPDRPIRCYTYTFPAGDMSRDQFEYDYPYAQRVAQLLDVDLVSFELRPDVLSLLPKLVYALDEPDADGAILAAYLICKAAREDATTVLLSGTGGDEVLFGYRSFQALRHLERIRWLPRAWVAPLLRVGMVAASRVFGAQGALPRRLGKFRRTVLSDDLEQYMALSDWSRPEVREQLFSSDLTADLNGNGNPARYIEKYFRGFEGCGELNRRSHVLIQTFLASHNFLYTDKTSMASSVEVRVPFLDVEMMRLCARIPERMKLYGQTGKYLLKEAMRRYLPGDVLYRSKTGFGLPLRKWLAEDLKNEVRELLSPERLRARGLFNPDVVRTILDENEANRADHAFLIFGLLWLEIWMQTFVDGAVGEVSLDWVGAR